MKIKVLRYANEGFKNYTHKIKRNNEFKEIQGCYAFVKKSFKGPLVYNYFTHLKNRNFDNLNTLMLSSKTLVYGRRFNPKEIQFRGKKNCFLKFDNDMFYDYFDNTVYKEKRIETDFNLNWNFNEDFHLMELGEVYDQIVEYENLISKIKKLGYNLHKKDVTYVFYEIIIDTKLLNKENHNE